MFLVSLGPTLTLPVLPLLPSIIGVGLIIPEELYFANKKYFSISSKGNHFFNFSRVSLTSGEFK